MRIGEVIGRGGRRRGTGWTVLVVVAWTIAVSTIAARHTFWADEVRALSIAIQGDTVFAMLAALHGDGHPALWYLMVRGAHLLLASPWALPATAFAAAFATTVLLVARSPFAWTVILLFVVGRIGLYEYAVVARNYGIGAVCMFAFAASYARHRERGLVLGALLFLLANCNVLAAILAVAYLGFWWLDLPPDDRSAKRVFVRNAGVAVLGIAVAAATVFPTYNDAAPIALTPSGAATALASAFVLPGRAFYDIAGVDLWGSLVDFSTNGWLWTMFANTVLLVAATLGLRHRPAALVAALAALVAFAVFFSVVYGGSYRHQASWIVFLMSLYWIAGPDGRGRVAALGRGAFIVLLVVQVMLGMILVGPIVAGTATESRVRDLADLIARDARLRDAIVMADPDDLVEALPFYLDNPLYLPRERRFGPYARFTRVARLDLQLDDLLEDARALRRSTGRPVLVLLSERLERDQPARVVHENYNWTLSITPQATTRFLAGTERLAQFAPVCCSPERFDVYLVGDDDR